MPLTEPVEGHEDHELVERAHGPEVYRVVWCATCSTQIIWTFAPAEYELLNLTLDPKEKLS